MNSETVLGVGLIGCGEIGRLRAEAVYRSRSSQLRAVADLESTLAARVASKYRAAEVTFDQLLGRDDIDIIIVSTPPSSHVGLTIQALNNGKHVLCEKPLASTVEECSKMIRAAEESGQHLATGFNYRFYPSIRKAFELLQEGKIGELGHIRSYAGYSASELTHAWMRDARVMGGGALRDNGIHLIDLTCYFLGEVADVIGATSNCVWRFDGCEDNGVAILRNPAGKMATLHASWTEWRGYRFQIDIYGTRGCIRASCFPMYTDILWSNEPGGRRRRKRYLFPMTHLWEKLKSYRWVVVQSFIEEIDAFGRAIRNQPSQVASGHDGLRAVMVAERASNEVE